MIALVSVHCFLITSSLSLGLPLAIMSNGHDICKVAKYGQFLLETHCKGSPPPVGFHLAWVKIRELVALLEFESTQLPTWAI